MAQLAVTRLPGLSQIELALITADFPTGPLPPDVMHAVIAEPAYWAFCWGSGLALARYLLQHPHTVQGKHVVDLGCGSGIAAIAAAVAGAANVLACDTDADARSAAHVNAKINGIDIAISDSLPQQCDIVLLADVLYDRQNLPLLNLVQSCAAEVLVADSRITQLPDPSYAQIAVIEALTYPNLGEFDEFSSAHLFHWQRQAR